MRLNPAQLAVATSRAARIIAQAGAGTGKTAASVGWICGLLEDGVPPEAIMMLTFTRKAAMDMVSRAAKLAGDSAKKITSGTYHAVSSSMIRLEPAGFGVGSAKFSLLDEGDSRGLWKSAARVCGFHSSEPAPSTVGAIVSLAKNKDVDVLGVLRERMGDNAVEMFQAYELLKKNGFLLDYDDLLVRWRNRLRDDSEYAARLRARFRYVLVDEVQDNNRLQYDIVARINPEHLLVVGDVNQSIYGFRSAEPALLARFRDENPEADVLCLDINYRSAQPILDLANHVIKGSSSPITLRSHDKRSSVVRAIQFATVEQEAKSICEDIQSHRRSGVRSKDIAVLARSSRTLILLEIELRRAHIEYKKYGGQTIAEAAEVKDFTAFLRITHNIKDRPALIRVATMFPGVGEIRAERAADAGDIVASVPKQASQAIAWAAHMRGVEFVEALRFLQVQIAPLIKRNYPENYPERMATISSLVSEFSESGANITEFLDAFVTERFEGAHPDTALTLSTIHSAKGLEWEHLYLIGVGSHQMPHPRALDSCEREEERRLMYVALTRARTHLTISFPSFINRTQQKASGFLPDEIVWLNV